MIHQLLTCYNIDIRRYCCSLNLLLYVLLIFVFRLSLLLSYFLYKNLLVLHWRKKCLSKFSISFKYSAISVEMYYIFATLWGRSPSKEFFSSFTEFWLGLQPASLWPWPTFSCQLRTIGGGGGRFSVLGMYLGLSVTLPPLEIIYH